MEWLLLRPAPLPAPTIASQLQTCSHFSVDWILFSRMSLPTFSPDQVTSFIEYFNRIKFWHITAPTIYMREKISGIWLLRTVGNKDIRSPPEEPHLAWVDVIFWVTSLVSPELLSCAIGLKFWYVGVWPCCSKLARGIDHLWSWARFMAAQILTINFVNRASRQNLWPKFERP